MPQVRYQAEVWPPALEARMALAVERGIRIGGVDEDVRVRDEH
ncbi:MAG TPA: hypothetical protein VN494_09220 [Patescibacteria group bacterium]|nr:hypothetical protein [Patescibacteria group bacterium]